MVQITMWSGLGILLLVTWVSCHSAFDNCTSALDCPGSTRCRCNGPRGYQCRCEDGFTVAGHGGHECVKASKLGESCDDVTNKCVPAYTYCNPDLGKCECLSFFRLSTDNSMCVRPGVKEIGETCNNDGECELLQSCNTTTKVCECRDGFRLKTQTEYDSDPDNPINCVPDNFTLEDPQYCPVTTVAALTSTTTTIPTDSTTVTAVTITTPLTANLSLGDSCSNDMECPDNASCQIRGCSGGVCTCDVGFVASADSNSCLIGSMIGDPCNSTSKCVPFYSYCSDICRCTFYVRESSGPRRTCASFYTYMLGEFTPSSSLCMDPHTVRSRDGKCQCETGYRPKTDEEFWDNPYDSKECVKEDFSLDFCNVTTTSLATTSVGTTTAAATGEKLIGDSCLTDTDCPLNSACRVKGCQGSVCTCNVGYLQSSNKSSCIQGSMIGDPCNSTSKCVPFYSYCSDICRCTFYVRESSGPRRTCASFYTYMLGEFTPSSSLCMDPHTVRSRDGKCQCETGYRPKTDEEFWDNPYDSKECVEEDFSLETCVTTTTTSTTTSTTTTTTTTVPIRNKLISESCINDGDCPLNAVCRERSCTGRVCVCDVHYITLTDKRTCLQGKLIGDSCSHSTECAPSLSYCTGICICPRYKRVTPRKTCVLTFYRAVGESCTQAFECQDGNADCVSGRCTCKSGFREKTNEELWNNLNDETECVPVEFNLGCQNPSSGRSLVSRGYYIPTN